MYHIDPMNPTAAEPSADPSTQKSPPLLVGKGLLKVYAGSRQPALNGLDMAVHAGEIVGLLGPNGAGKTTAVSILATVLPPTEGRVLIDQYNARRHARLARTRIGLVPQHIALYPNLTGQENLRFFGRLHGLTGKTLQHRIQAALTMTGLLDRSDRRVATYSGGMQRRLNFAAGVLHHPKVLFLDEPTVGIDAQSRHLIFEQLLTLKRRHTAIVYTTHYMEEAEAICDRVLIIDDGRAVSRGRPQDLIAQHSDCRNLGDLFLKLTGKALRD